MSDEVLTDTLIEAINRGCDGVASAVLREQVRRIVREQTRIYFGAEGGAANVN